MGQKADESYFFLGYVQEGNDLENAAMHKDRVHMHKEAIRKMAIFGDDMAILGVIRCFFRDNPETLV